MSRLIEPLCWGVGIVLTWLTWGMPYFQIGLAIVILLFVAIARRMGY